MMRKSLLTIFLIMPLSSFAAPNGTISFSGIIQGQTCDVTVGGSGSNNATVALPLVSSSALSSSGQSAGATNFVINLSNCNLPAGSVRAFFESGVNVDPVTGNLKNNGSAQNVQVQLMSEAGTPLHAGSESQHAQAAVSLNNGAAKINYIAQYYAVDTVTTGDVSTSVTYSIEYI